MWKGGDKNNAKTNNTQASELAEMINKQVDREANPWCGKDIYNKIAKIEDSFLKAVDWLNGTGAGCLKEGTTIEDYVNSICIHYYDLKPFMFDWPSTKYRFLVGTIQSVHDTILINEISDIFNEASARLTPEVDHESDDDYVNSNEHDEDPANSTLESNKTTEKKVGKKCNRI